MLPGTPQTPQTQTLWNPPSLHPKKFHQDFLSLVLIMWDWIAYLCPKGSCLSCVYPCCWRWRWRCWAFGGSAGNETTWLVGWVEMNAAIPALLLQTPCNRFFFFFFLRHMWRQKCVDTAAAAVRHSYNNATTTRVTRQNCYKQHVAEELEWSVCAPKREWKHFVFFCVWYSSVAVMTSRFGLSCFILQFVPVQGVQPLEDPVNPRRTRKSWLWNETV